MAPTAPKRPVIAVVGSLNVDLVTRTKRIPNAGETLASQSFDVGFGGKGANQAVACARLSRPKAHSKHDQARAEVKMYGAIGNDQFAGGFLDSLKKDGLNVEGVRTLEGQKTGVAVILVEEDTGENRILFNPGANHAIPTSGLVSWTGVNVALFQLEIPLDIVIQNIKDAKAANCQTILNPAPAVPLPDDIYQFIDHLIMNESEASILSGRNTSDIDPRQPSRLASVFYHFISKGVKCVVITLGAHGAVYQTAESDGFQHVEAATVKVVDTTAAGDTFVGAYAVKCGQNHAQGGMGYVDGAIRKANKAAGLTVQRHGAQSAIPWLDEVGQ